MRKLLLLLPLLFGGCCRPLLPYVEIGFAHPDPMIQRQILASSYAPQITERVLRGPRQRIIERTEPVGIEEVRQEVEVRPRRVRVEEVEARMMPDCDCADPNCDCATPEVLLEALRRR